MELKWYINVLIRLHIYARQLNSLNLKAKPLINNHQKLQRGSKLACSHEKVMGSSQTIVVVKVHEKSTSYLNFRLYFGLGMVMESLRPTRCSGLIEWNHLIQH